MTTESGARTSWGNRAPILVVAVGSLLTVLTAVLVVAVIRADVGSTGLTTATTVPTEAAEPEYALDEIGRYEMPTSVAMRPDTTDLYVTLLEGHVRRVQMGDDGRPAGDAEGDEVLDLSDRVNTEQGGLVTITFDPEGAFAYLAYTNRERHLVVDAHPVADDGTLGARREILLVERRNLPNNHIGGGLRFGPDGYLYVGVGDDGVALLEAPDPASLMGKVLRLDPRPEGPGGYDIPPDNPYASGERGRPEVWTAGMRNPFRLTFDPERGDLWIADVGEERVEELNRLGPGEQGGRAVNLGWPQYAGVEPYIDEPSPTIIEATPPSFEYDHQDGRCGVIGGVVYRGEELTDLVGNYLFSDICSKALLGLREGPDGTLEEFVVATAPEAQMVSVDSDAAGHVYLTSTSGGVYLLTPG